MYMFVFILQGLAVLLIGASWFIQRKTSNGLLFIVLFLGLLASLTTSFWKMIFGFLAALVAITSLVVVLRRKKSS